MLANVNVYGRLTKQIYELCEQIYEFYEHLPLIKSRNKPAAKSFLSKALLIAEIICDYAIYVNLPYLDPN